MKFARVMGVVLLLACASALADGGGAKITVKQGFPPGQYLMTQAGHEDSTTTMNGNAQPSVDDTKYVWSLDVPKPDSQGEKKVALRLTLMQSHATAQGKEMSFDGSAADANQDPDAVFVYRPLMDVQAQITLDSDDTVLEVTGLDKYWDDLEQKATTPTQKMMITQSRLVLGDKAIELLLRRHESIMPRDAVAVGDSWKAGTRVDLPIVGEIKARYDCKLLDGSNADQAIIGADGQYESTSPKDTTIQGIDITVASMQVKEQATLKVDLKSGLVSSDDQTTDTTVAFKMKNPNGGDLTATTESKGKNSLTITRADAATAGAGANPFAQPQAAANPLSPAANGGWAGKYTGDKLSMDIKADGEQYSGTLTLADHDYPFSGTTTAYKMQGNFKSGNDSFPFTASLDGDTLTFETSGTTYTLKRSGAAAAEPAPAAAATAAIDPAKLLGTWQITQGRKSTTLVFNNDGTFGQKDQAPEEASNVTGSYKLQGNQLSLTKPTFDMNDPTKRGEETKSVTIVSVDDNQLVLKGLGDNNDSQTLKRVAGQ